MSSEEAVKDAVSLCQTFDQSVDLLNFVEETEHPSNSPQYQDAVKNAIELLEKATKMVNQLALFSSNETIEEVSTTDLKYLLLPAFLGYFTSKLSTSDAKERLDQLRLSELYYKDFLKRCKSYELSNVDIPQFDDDEEKEVKESLQSQRPDLTSLNVLRNEKIKRYKMMREVEEKINQLKDALNFDDDHEKKREYYLTLLKKWVFQSCDELSSTKDEKNLLRNMPTRKINVKEPKKEIKPLKPIVIVRNELQKKVFGMGYPSLPTMTVDEFYAQRYPDSENGNTTTMSPMQSLQQMAADPERSKRQQELEDEQEDHLRDIDDPLTIQNSRAFDDWKDENRRGCGNRMNKG